MVEVLKDCQKPIVHLSVCGNVKLIRAVLEGIYNSKDVVRRLEMYKCTYAH